MQGEHPTSHLFDETLPGHGGSKASSQDGTTHGDSLQGSVHHLVAVTGGAALVEVGHVVTAGEGSVGHLLVKELAQRAPAIVDVVFKQAVGGHQAADLSNMLVVDLLSLALEVAAEESLEELVQHGVVHAGGPAEVGDELVLGVADTPVDGLHDGTDRELARLSKRFKTMDIHTRATGQHHGWSG